MQLAVYAGSCIAVWLLAWGVTAAYAKIEITAAERRGATPMTLEFAELPADARSLDAKITAFREQHEKMEIPFESTMCWLPDGKSELVSADRRAYTLQLFDTPEMREFCRHHEVFLQMLQRPDVFYMRQGMLARSFARICAGRAALFRESGQPEKILPELDKITVLDHEILNSRSMLVIELIRIACRSFWYSSVVRLGPDDPKYAPRYREALAFMNSREVAASDETGFFLGIAGRMPCRNFGELLAAPVADALIASSLNHIRRTLPKLTEWAQCEVFVEPSSMEAKIALRGRISLVEGRMLLALKCYCIGNKDYYRLDIFDRA